MLLLTSETQDAALEALDAVAIPSTTRTILPFSERQTRLDLCRSDVPGFGKVYAPEYVPEEYADHHYTIFQVMSLQTGRLAVILLPRGAGKSTILFIIALHAVCFSLEKYILLVEHDGVVAQSVTKKFVKMFEENPNIIQDFPNVRPSVPWKPSGGELNFTNGTLLRCIGLNQLRSRGSTHHESRITFAIMNDLVDLKNARSATETAFIYDLATKDIAKAGPLPGEGILRRCYLGTSISQTDAAWQLSTAPMSKVIKIPAVRGEHDTVKALMQVISDDARQINDYCDALEAQKLAQVEAGILNPEEATLTNVERWEYLRSHREQYEPFFAFPEPGYEDGFCDETDSHLKSYWPQVYSMAYFTFVAAEDTSAFMQEFQHVTGDTSLLLFYTHWIQPYQELSKDVLDRLIVGLSVDPSCTQEDTKNNDPAALIAIGYDPVTKDRYWLYVCEDWLTPDALVYKIFEIANAPVPFVPHLKIKDLPGFRVYFESNQAQVFGLSLLDTTRKYEIELKRKAFYPAEEGETIQRVRPVEYHEPSYWSRFPVRKVNQTENKIDRINSTRSVFEQRRHHYIPGHSQQDLLRSQYGKYQGMPTHGASIPLERKIDGIDAVTTFENQISDKPKKSASAGETTYKHATQPTMADRYLNEKNA